MRSNIIVAASAGSPDPMPTRHHLSSTKVGQFYDALWQHDPSPGALAYGEAHRGQECLLTADEILALAHIAGINRDTFVLDIGSGTGGPACYLAHQTGCRVLGLDVSAVGQAQAQARAHTQGLHHLVAFRQCDVHTMELPEASVDVILSLDAWCHIPQRASMLQRCATWLRPGGRLAFYDQVERHPLPAEQRACFYAQWHFPDLETPLSYLAIIKAAGLQVDFEVETSVNAARFYTPLLEAYQAQHARLAALQGAASYQAALARLRTMQHFAACGIIGQIGCIALKPDQP